ncbi:MAG: hypothetical protein ACK5C0_04275 [Candidatus Kapaibacterium sp.]|jgi:hypothetical protein
MKHLLLCTMLIAFASHHVFANDNAKKAATKKAAIPVMVGAVLQNGTNTVTDPQTKTDYTIVYNDGAIQSVTIANPNDKSTKELLPKQEKIPDFCPEAALCFTNPFDKKQVCVCMPPAPIVRSGQPIKTVWRFTTVR